jgi:uncharacterized protein YraI
MGAIKRLLILAIFSAMAVAMANAETIQITARNGANFRARPQGKRIGGLPNGARLTVLERRGSWAKVKYGKATGWVYTQGAARTVETEKKEVTAEIPPVPISAPIPEEKPDADVTAEVTADVEELPDPVAPKGGKPGAMRYDTVAASGRCMTQEVKTDAQAKSLLRYYDIKTPGSTEEERINLAQGIFQVSALYGGKFPPFVGGTMKFSSRKGFSRYTGGDDTIDLNRCDKRGRNCGASANINPARLIHEFGHRFGHAKFDGKNTYYDYFRKNLKRCYMTGYADNNLKENVAEVFSAYITRPERLSAGSKACKQNFEFLKTQVFNKNGGLASCSPEGIAALKNSILGLDGTQNVATSEDYAAIFRSPASRVAASVTAAEPEEVTAAALPSGDALLFLFGGSPASK